MHTNLISESIGVGHVPAVDDIAEALISTQERLLQVIQVIVKFLQKKKKPNK